jgi:hypothetical protein
MMHLCANWRNQALALKTPVARPMSEMGINEMGLGAAG